MLSVCAVEILSAGCTFPLPSEVQPNGLSGEDERRSDNGGAEFLDFWCSNFVRSSCGKLENDIVMNRSPGKNTACTNLE